MFLVLAGCLHWLSISCLHFNNHRLTARACIPQVQASLQAADTRLALLEAQLAQLPEGELSPNAVDPAGSGEGLDATDSGQALDALASGDGHGHRASGGTVSDVHACTNQAPRAADILQADSPQTAKSGQPDPAFSGQPDHNALDAAEAAGEAMTRDAEADGSGERSGGLTGPAAASDDADDYASGGWLLRRSVTSDER